MIRPVSAAEQYLVSQNAWDNEKPLIAVKSKKIRGDVSELRQKISLVAGNPVLLNLTNTPDGISFSKRDDVEKIATRGPLTPDHVIRTKRIPMIGRDVEKYVKDYVSYFDIHKTNAKEKKTMLDPAPRVILDREFGLCAVGKNMSEIGIISDIYEHTIESILRAEKL